MVTPSQTLVTRTKEETTSNGWEKLLPLLDPAIVNASQVKNVWKKMDRQLVFYLTNTVGKFPWLNHIALEGAIYNESGAVHPLGPIHTLHPFLRWAIPNHYPNVSAFNPVEALIAFFDDPPQPRGGSACSAYLSLQLHMQDYLRSLTDEERTKLTPFLFPILAMTPRLMQLRMHIVNLAHAKRKEQAFAVVRDLHTLVAMGRQRYKWLADLDTQVQRIAELVQNEQVVLPAVIGCKDLDNRQDLTFRAWDRMSWIKAHRHAYHKHMIYDRKRLRDHGLFLQLVGTLPDTPWFLRAAELGVLGDQGNMYPSARKYFRDRNNPPLRPPGKGLLVSNIGVSMFLRFAREAAEGTPTDSHTLFCVEPLLAAAALGLFALVCLTQSGMRVGELQQISGDKACMKIGIFPTFDDNAHNFAEHSTKLFFWQLYPKGNTERELYPVTPYMQEALKVWIEVHDRFCGNFKEVSATQTHFFHARRFPGKQRFILQWKGKHLRSSSIETCVDFLLLEHHCLDSQGKPTRITAHVLRHGVAGYLRQQGVPLEDIATLLHQVNVLVTDYYSKLSPQELFAKVGPFLTRLGEVAEIDPATLRTVGDIQKLEQEALKRFGVLRRIPGGTCAVFTACEVQFKCASCPSYIPDPTRREEVREKITSCVRTTQFLKQSGDFLQAEVQRAHGYHWERIEKEMQALAAIELTVPPFESALKEFGLDHLDQVDDEWLLSLKQPLRLSPGGEHPHG